MPRKSLKVNRRAKWRLPEVPTTLQYDYYQALMVYTGQVASIFESTVMSVVGAEADKNVALDAKVSPIDVAFRLFMSRVSKLSKTKVNAAAVKMVNGVEIFQRSLFVSNIKKSVGVDVFAIVTPKQVSAEIAEATKANFDLIKSIGPSYRDRGRAIVDEALRTGKTRQTMEKELLEMGGFRDSYKGTEQRRAKTIARDQSQKFSKSIDNVRSKKIGAKHFVWVNSGDSRVRDDHSQWGGHRFSYADPPGGELPGDAVQCRCHARPDTEEILAALEVGVLE